MKPLATVASQLALGGGSAGAASGQPSIQPGTPAAERPHDSDAPTTSQQACEADTRLTPTPKTKSTKRRAAEALLASYYSSGNAAGQGAAADVHASPSALTPSSATAAAAAAGGGRHTPDFKRHCSSQTPAAPSTSAPSPSPPLPHHAAHAHQAVHGAPVRVAACPPICACHSSTGWCHFEVKIPQVNWQRVFDGNASGFTVYNIAPGYERVFFPEGLQAYLVEHPRHVNDALARLRNSMLDKVVAIDLEWRPETQPGRASPVALLQLSSATVAVLIRTSAMNFKLPDAVRAFLADPQVSVVGFAWDAADEAKMTSTFQFGRDRMSNFIDLQRVAHDLGYHNFGLARLVKQVLGVPLLKSKAISRSNWAGHSLSLHQVKYASLDVLAAAQVFRGLRLWHSSPSACATCLQPLGAVLPAPDLTRSGGGGGGGQPQSYGDWQSYYNASKLSGEPVSYLPCASCGRLHQLKQPALVSAADDAAPPAVAATATAATLGEMAASGGGGGGSGSSSSSSSSDSEKGGIATAEPSGSSDSSDTANGGTTAAAAAGAVQQGRGAL